MITLELINKKYSKKSKIKMKRPSEKKITILCSNGIVYESITQAANELNLHISAISNVCKNKKTHAHGYKFSYM